MECYKYEFCCCPPPNPAWLWFHPCSSWQILQDGTHFMPCKLTIDVVNMAQIFFHDLIIRMDFPLWFSLIGTLVSWAIFWKSVWKMANMSLDFSSTYHPQTNRQTEVINHSLGNLLRCLVRSQIKSWDIKNSQAEFAHNLAINRSTCLSPFQISYDILLHGPVDLIALPSPQLRHLGCRSRATAETRSVCSICALLPIKSVSLFSPK